MAAFDGYSYYINEDSDDEEIRRDSSDEEELDEVDVFLRGTKQQQLRVLKSLTGEASSSDDDFEKVMQNELEAKVKDITNSWKKSENPDQTPDKGASASTSRQTEYYDDVYFDSDDEQNNSSQSRKRIMTDDELLYDPSADDEDQKWVDMQRKRSEEMNGTTSGKAKKLVKSMKAKGSDAVLNCPACMSTLCVDCQRHSIYDNQYRAMFVMNCSVKMDEVLHYKPKQKREFKRHKRRKQGEPKAECSQASSSIREGLQQGSGDAPSDTYHPVKCSTCSTEVAVYDSDEIYHFFNILSSYA